MQKILANRIRCKYCGDIIESRHCGDCQFCSCARVGVYGGKVRLGRIAIFSHADYEDLSVCEEEKDDNLHLYEK